jgi:hypothetical protein
MCAKAPSFFNCLGKAVVSVQSNANFGSIVEPKCATNGVMAEEVAAFDPATPVPSFWSPSAIPGISNGACRLPHGVLERERGEKVEADREDAKQQENERQRHHAEFDGRRSRLLRLPTPQQLNCALASALGRSWRHRCRLLPTRAQRAPLHALAALCGGSVEEPVNPRLWRWHW